MAKKARAGKECLAAARREVIGSADASAGPPTTVIGAAQVSVVPGERQPRRGQRHGQHGWTEASGAGGMRAKASFEGRAQAGAMLRLARVMRNR